MLLCWLINICVLCSQVKLTIGISLFHSLPLWNQVSFAVGDKSNNTRTALVFGGNGLIGSATVTKLLSAHYSVVLA